MLKQKAKAAVLWSGADIFLRQGLQFGISIILARLLSPEEFGTIALLYLFTGLASVFVDGGFSTALIQRQDINQTDESTVFWFNLSVGFIVALGMWAIAPAIAKFFKQPVLAPLAGLMAINVILSAFGSIHGTLLTKKLDFRTQMKAGGIATAISGGAAIVMAWHGLGVWALAVQTVVATLFTTVLLWKLNSWRPDYEFSMTSVRKLFGFGGYILASGLLDITYNRLYTLLIGKLYGVQELGFYSRAEGTKQLPVGVLTAVLSRVAFPVFSAAISDIDQLRRGVQLSVRVMMLVNVPMMLVLMAIAEPLIQILFGDQWLPAVPILQILCFAGVFWPLHVINLNVLMAQGHSSLFFRLEVLKKILGIGALAVGAFYGVMGIAWSQVVFGVFAFFINAFYTGRHIGYGALSQIQDFYLVFILSFLFFAFGIPTLTSLFHEKWIALMVSVPAVTGLFFLTAWLLRVPGIGEVGKIIKLDKKNA